MVKKIKRRQPKAEVKTKPGFGQFIQSHSFDDFEVEGVELGQHESIFGSDISSLNEDDFEIPLSPLPKFSSLSPLTLLAQSLSILKTSTDDFATRQKPLAELKEVVIKNEQLCLDQFDASSFASAKTYQQQLKQLKKAYQVDQPLSSISSDFFWGWSVLDLTINQEKQSLVQKLLAEETSASPDMMAMLQAISKSRLGLYIYEDQAEYNQAEHEAYGLIKENRKILLKDYESQTSIYAYIPESKALKVGQLLLLRLVSLPVSTLKSKPNKSRVQPLLISIQSPYVLGSNLHTTEFKSEPKLTILWWLESISQAESESIQLEQSEQRVILLKALPMF
jgi:hypothetical protein